MVRHAPSARLTMRVESNCAGVARWRSPQHQTLILSRGAQRRVSKDEGPRKLVLVSLVVASQGKSIKMAITTASQFSGGVTRMIGSSDLRGIMAMMPAFTTD